MGCFFFSRKISTPITAATASNAMLSSGHIYRDKRFSVSVWEASCGKQKVRPKTIHHRLRANCQMSVIPPEFAVSLRIGTLCRIRDCQIQSDTAFYDNGEAPLEST